MLSKTKKQREIFRELQQGKTVLPFKKWVYESFDSDPFLTQPDLKLCLLSQVIYIKTCLFNPKFSERFLQVSWGKHITNVLSVYLVWTYCRSHCCCSQENSVIRHAFLLRWLSEFMTIGDYCSLTLHLGHNHSCITVTLCCPFTLHFFDHWHQTFIDVFHIQR